MIKEVLDKIIENGYSCYIVGGFVRDYILGKNNTDVDIITNASKSELIKMFPSAKETKNYESIHYNIPPYNIDISRYRVESNLINGIPKQIEYVDDFKLDSKRRDFTINSIYLDRDFNIVDPFNYKADLDNKIIRVIGDTNSKFDEDPLRILRSIRLHIVYDFKLSDDIIAYIKNNPNKLNEIDAFKKKKEINKIVDSGNREKLVNFISCYKIDEDLLK